MTNARITVVETKPFTTRAASRLTADEVTGLVSQLSSDPLCGIPLGGGVYKVRVGHGARGKSGGVRVVYLFATEASPIFLLTVFAKNEQDNLSKKELVQLVEAGKLILKEYGG